MTAHNESPADLDMPSLDTAPACEVPDCDDPAEFRAKYFHIFDRPESCHSGKMFLLCPEHLGQSVEKHRALFRVGPGFAFECGRCRERLSCVRDLIRSVVSL